MMTLPTDQITSSVFVLPLMLSDEPPLPKTQDKIAQFIPLSLISASTTSAEIQELLEQIEKCKTVEEINKATSYRFSSDPDQSMEQILKAKDSSESQKKEIRNGENREKSKKELLEILKSSSTEIDADEYLLLRDYDSVDIRSPKPEEASPLVPPSPSPQLIPPPEIIPIRSSFIPPPPPSPIKVKEKTTYEKTISSISSHPYLISFFLLLTGVSIFTGIGAFNPKLLSNKWQFKHCYPIFLGTISLFVLTLIYAMSISLRK